MEIQFMWGPTDFNFSRALRFKWITEVPLIRGSIIDLKCQWFEVQVAWNYFNCNCGSTNMKFKCFEVEWLAGLADWIDLGFNGVVKSWQPLSGPSPSSSSSDLSDSAHTHSLSLSLSVSFSLFCFSLFSFLSLFSFSLLVRLPNLQCIVPCYQTLPN